MMRSEILVDFMICLYQAGSQSEGERIRGRGTYLGENLDPRVIMYDHVMVGIEWKMSFRIGDNPQNKMIFFLFIDTTGFLRENDLLWRLGW